MFDSLVAYKSDMLNESSTEFWMNSTDTEKCFTKDTNADLITISADLSYDLSTEACQQKHGGIQLGVSERRVSTKDFYSVRVHFR